MDFPIDHIGIAVADLDKGKERFCQTLGYRETWRESLTSFQVELVMLEHSSSATRLELITPLEGNESLHRFIDSRGEGMHHLCYRVQGIESVFDAFKKEGLRALDKAPREGAHGSVVAFFHPKDFSGVLLEICEY